MKELVLVCHVVEFVVYLAPDLGVTSFAFAKQPEAPESTNPRQVLNFLPPVTTGIATNIPALIASSLSFLAGDLAMLNSSSVFELLSGPILKDTVLISSVQVRSSVAAFFFEPSSSKYFFVRCVPQKFLERGLYLQSL